MHAVITRQAAVVDPPPWWLLLPLWWSLEREPGTDAYVGPFLYLDGFAEPALPPEGLPLATALQRYLRAVPGTTGSRACRVSPLLAALQAMLAGEPELEVRRYRHASALWRRTVAILSSENF